MEALRSFALFGSLHRKRLCGAAKLILPIILFTPVAALADAGSKQIVLTPITDTPSYDKFALVVGIDSYDDAQSLTSPGYDARLFASLLQSKFGFSSVTLMTSDAAAPSLRPTQHNVERALRNLCHSLRPGVSEVVVFFSGHGARTTSSADGDTDWLVPSDGDPEDIPDTCINYEKFRTSLDTIGPARAVLITDACRDLKVGMGFGEGLGFGAAALASHVGPEIAELFSCEPRQISREGDPRDFPESVFTHFLIQGLKGDRDAADPGSDEVTFDTLKRYVRGHVSQYVASRFNDAQTPDGRATEGDMVLTRLAPDQVVPPPAAVVAVHPTPATAIQEIPPVRPAASDPPASVAGDDNVEVQFEQARLLMSERRYAEAETILRNLIHAAPSNAECQDALGVLLSYQNRLADAEPYYREAIRLAPNNAAYRDHMACMYNLQARFGDAEALCRSAVQSEPTNARYLSDLGRSLFGLQQYAQAEAFYRQAVMIELTNPGYQYDLARDLDQQNKVSEAERCYREAIRLAPGTVSYQDDLGRMLNRVGRYADAESFCRAAVQSDPNNSRYADNLAVSLFGQQRYADAEIVYAQCVRLEPGNADYRHCLACTQDEQNKFTEAEASYRESIRLAPNDVACRDHLGCLLSREGRYADAELLCRAAAQAEPANARYQEDAGTALFGQQKYADAAAFYRKAVQLAPDNPDYQRNLTLALAQPAGTVQIPNEPAQPLTDRGAKDAPSVAKAGPRGGEGAASSQ